MSLITSRSGHCQTVIEHCCARGQRAVHVLGLLMGLFAVGGYDVAHAGTSLAPTAISTTAAAATAQPEESRMWMTVGEHRFAITLADTEAARAFAAMLPLTIDMPDLNGNEKHAKLPRALPTSSIRPGTIRNGDLMLYGSQTLVVFYLTFDSVYAYTPLGQVDAPTDLARVLGSGAVRIRFSRD
ncbi:MULTISPECIES: cyclophilin-like fold protein [Pseudomonas]|nr:MULTISPECIES: cyclophilin-like fold protein [Pseudomonas]